MALFTTPESGQLWKTPPRSQNQIDLHSHSSICVQEQQPWNTYSRSMESDVFACVLFDIWLSLMWADAAYILKVSFPCITHKGFWWSLMHLLHGEDYYTHNRLAEETTLSKTKRGAQTIRGNHTFEDHSCTASEPADKVIALTQWICQHLSHQCFVK